MSVQGMIEDRDCYCRKCGGLVDLKNSLVKLSSPPQYQYHCKSCFAHVITVRGDTYTNVQDQSK